MKKLSRQGDVLLVPVETVPKTAQQIKPQNGRLILAYGEATGHHHSVIESSNVELLDVPTQQEMYLLVKEGDALLEHQEHAPLTIEPGKYKVVIQREYAPTEIKRVVD